MTRALAPGAAPESVPLRSRIRAGGSARAYTVVEVIIALAVLAVGAAGVIAMQKMDGIEPAPAPAAFATKNPDCGN